MGNGGGILVAGLLLLVGTHPHESCERTSLLGRRVGPAYYYYYLLVSLYCTTYIANARRRSAPKLKIVQKKTIPYHIYIVVGYPLKWPLTSRNHCLVRKLCTTYS